MRRITTDASRPRGNAGSCLGLLSFCLLSTTSRGVQADADFVRGDANADGRVSISDALTIRRFLFNGDAVLVSCLDAGDVDDNNTVNLTDVIRILADLFLAPGDKWGDPSFAMPFPSAGPDPTTEGGPGCVSYVPVPAELSSDTIRIGDVEAQPGAEVSIPFYLTSSVEVEALQLVVAYDPNVFTPATGGLNPAFDLEGTYFKGILANNFRGFISSYARPELGIFTVAVVGSLDEEGAEVKPGEDILLFRVRGTVSSTATPGTSISLAPTDGADGNGVQPPLNLRNELTSKGGARFVSSLPRKVPGLLAIIDDITFFIRGDSNGDGTVDVSDAAHVLGYLFLGTSAPVCNDAADTNDSGEIDITDAVVILEHLFLGTSTIAPPFPAEGGDPTPDALGTCHP